MTYEYDFEDMGLTEEQRKLVDLGMAKIEDINVKIKDIINKRGKDNWEPLYPFSVPMLWFKRTVTSKKTKKN